MTFPTVSGVDLDPAALIAEGGRGYATSITANGYTLPRWIAMSYACTVAAYDQTLAAAAGLTGTSASSVAIGTGSKSFTASTGKTWQAGMAIALVRAADANVFMVGQVTSYNSTTGALVVNVLDTRGTGTFSDWNIALSGRIGPQGYAGWSPILAVVADGARSVLQVVDWTGGEGAEPAVGSYVGAAGLVADIADAVDIRGATGPIGAGTTIDAAQDGTPVTVAPRSTINVQAPILAADDAANDRINISLDNNALGGSATVTSGATPITLTAASARVQAVTMTTAAQHVTLPDATTLSLGGPLYVIHNKGDRPFGVRSNGGTLLAVVAAGAVAECSLDSNGTAAGSWTIGGRGLEPALTLVDYTFPSSTANTAAEVACRLTDTLSLHFGFNTGGFFIYALAVDTTPSAASAGVPTMVGSVNSAADIRHAFRISDTQAILFWVESTNYKAAVLTVDPVTKAVSVGTAASTATAFLTNVTFTGRPLIAQMTASLYIALWCATPNSTALAISVSGTTVTIGTSAGLGAAFTSPQQALAIYRVTDTTALALVVDDAGTAGSPYSIRGAVLSVSGTTITVGTSAGVNDVVGGSSASPSCQLSATSYVVGYYQSAGTLMRAVAVTVSGTTVTFGTPLTVETVTAGDQDYANYRASRFQPNLYPIDSTRVLFTYGGGGLQTRHVVLTNSAGTLTAGGILYALWDTNTGTGGNFPQLSDRFLAFSTAAAEMALFNVTISGTALSVTGTFADGAVVPTAGVSQRFGLSGGVQGIQQDSATRSNVVLLFKPHAGGAPEYRGALRLNDFAIQTLTPVEIAASKVAIIGKSLSGPDGTNNYVKLAIVEFAA